ncbi:hypothetical protein EWX89_02815 [Enterococcus faecium]|nr:hypothetical protein [Enterococcus faecium]EGP5216572.1 hypothetical protein [Enterococcus faecium]
MELPKLDQISKFGSSIYFVSVFFVYKKRECVAHLRNVQRRRQTIMNLWVRVKEIDRRYERLM